MSLFRRITDKSSIVFECREISEEQREELTKLVEKHGGRVGDSMDPIIFMPRLKYVCGTYINLQVFDIEYIQACVARGKLLSLGHFRLTPEKRGGRCQRTTFLTGECIFKRALADVTLAENCNYDSASLSEDDETVEAIECRVLNVSRVETAKTARSGVDASQSATHEEPVDRDEKIASNVSEQGIAANPSPERVSQSSDRATFRTALSGSVTKDTSSTPDTTVWESQVLSSDIEVDVIDDDTQIYKMLLKGSKSDNVKRSPEKRIPIEKTMASSSSESPPVRQSPSSQVETTRKHDLECMKSPVKQFKSISPGDVRRASNESLIDLLSGRKTPSPIQEFETARDDVEETPVARDFEPGSSEANTLPSNVALSEAAKRCDKAVANEENEKSAAKDQPENREEDEKSPRESLRDPQSPLVSHSRFVLHKNSLEPSSSKSSTLSSNAASSEPAERCDKAAANEESEKSGDEDQPEDCEEDEKSPRASLRDPQSPIVSHSSFFLHKNSIELGSSKSSMLSSNVALSEAAERCDKAAANGGNEKSTEKDQPEDREEDEKSPKESLRDSQSPIVSHSRFFLHKNSLEPGSSKSSTLSSNVPLSEAAERCDKAAANGGNEKSAEKDQPEDCEEDEKSPKESLRDPESPLVSPSPSSKSATTRKPLTKYYKSPVRKLKWIAPDDFQKSSKKRLRSTVDSADDDDGDETLFLDHDAIEISGEKVTLLKAAPIEPGESTDEATASRLTESCGKSRTKAKSENDSSLSDLPLRYTSPSSPETSNGTSAVVPLSKRRKRSFASPEAEQTKTKEGPYKTSGKRAKPGSSRIIIAETSSEDDDDEGLSAKTQAAAKRTHADTTECVISEDDEDDAWLPVKRRVAAKRTDTSSIENLSKESDEDYKPELVQRRRKADMPSRDHEKQLRFHQNWRAKLNAGVTQQEPGLRRLKFTSSDRKEMVKFLCTFEDIEAVQPKGLKVWALMIKSGLLSYRTVKSLQNHFTKSILPTIEEYFDGMSEAHQAQFLKIRGSKRG